MLLISQSRDRESRNAHVRIFRTDLHRGTKSDNSLQKAVTGSAKTPKIHRYKMLRCSLSDEYVSDEA
jgi:hypothetical protein